MAKKKTRKLPSQARDAEEHADQVQSDRRRACVRIKLVNAHQLVRRRAQSPNNRQTIAIANANTCKMSTHINRRFPPPTVYSPLRLALDASHCLCCCLMYPRM